MSGVEEWAALITALGLGTVIPAATKAIWKWATGKLGRERDAVEYERNRADAADTRADALDLKLDQETRLRRQWQDVAARYRYRLTVEGIDPDDLDFSRTVPPLNIGGPL